MKGMLWKMLNRPKNKVKSQPSLFLSRYCWLGLLTAFVLTFLFFPLKANAAQADYEYFGVYRTQQSQPSISQCLGQATYVENLHFNQTLPVCNLYSVLFQSTPVSFQGNNLTVSAKFNLVAKLGTQNSSLQFGHFQNLNNMELLGISLKDSNNNITTFTADSVSYQYYLTDWVKDGYKMRTLTVILTATGRASASISGQYRARVLFGQDQNSSNPILQMDFSTLNPIADPPQVYFEPTDTAVTINGTSSISDSLLQAQIDQNSTIINQNQTIIENQQATTDAINEQNERDQEDRDNLEQQSQDIEDSAEEYGAQAEAQGENFITIIRNFVVGLAGVSATDCIIDVDFSLYQGGNYNQVNICTGKNTYVATIINTVGGILLAVWIVREAVIIVQQIIKLWKENQE